MIERLEMFTMFFTQNNKRLCQQQIVVTPVGRNTQKGEVEQIILVMLEARFFQGSPQKIPLYLLSA